MLRQYGRRSDHRAGLEQCPPRTEWYWIAHVRRTVARPVVAEGVDAFVRRLDAHAVWQHRQPREEVGTGNEGLAARRPGVAVAFQLLVFEEQRLVTQGGRFPKIGGLRPGPAGVPLSRVQ